MADWYVSSAAWAGVSAFVPSATYALNNFVKATAPAQNAEHVFIVSAITTGVAGSTEPTWPTTNNGTVTSGGVTFKCVTGQSTYGWSAAGARIGTLNGGSGTARIAAGDRVFISSDHSETSTISTTLSLLNSVSLTGGNPVSIFSVNRTSGNIPPLQTDLTPGASFTYTGTSSTGILIDGCNYTNGLSFTSANNITFFSGSRSRQVHKNASFSLTAAAAKTITFTNPGNLLWDNCTLTCANAAQGIAVNSYGAHFEWMNTPNAIQGATQPTNLFQVASSTGALMATIHGVDLSAMGAGTNLVDLSVASQALSRFLFSNCKLNAAGNIIATRATTGEGAYVELIDCDSGNTNYRSERHTLAGDVTTETVIYLAAGASDGTTNFSRKMVTTSYANKLGVGLEGFMIDVWNTTVGVPQTATVQIVSSGTLTTQDMVLKLEYPSDANSPLTSFVSSHDVIATNNIPSSSAVWNSSPGTPVTQQLQVTFTAQKVGWLRAMITLYKGSTTVYYNPQITLS